MGKQDNFGREQGPRTPGRPSAISLSYFVKDPDPKNMYLIPLVSEFLPQLLQNTTIYEWKSIVPSPNDSAYHTQRVKEPYVRKA